MASAISLINLTKLSEQEEQLTAQVAFDNNLSKLFNRRTLPLSNAVRTTAHIQTNPDEDVTVVEAGVLQMRRINLTSTSNLGHIYWDMPVSKWTRGVDKTVDMRPVSLDVDGDYVTFTNTKQLNSGGCGMRFFNRPVVTNKLYADPTRQMRYARVRSDKLHAGITSLSYKVEINIPIVDRLGKYITPEAALLVPDANIKIKYHAGKFNPHNLESLVRNDGHLTKHSDTDWHDWTLAYDVTSETKLAHSENPDVAGLVGKRVRTRSVTFEFGKETQTLGRMEIKGTAVKCIRVVGRMKPPPGCYAYSEMSISKWLQTNHGHASVLNVLPRDTQTGIDHINVTSDGVEINRFTKPVGGWPPGMLEVAPGWIMTGGGEIDKVKSVTINPVGGVEYMDVVSYKNKAFANTSQIGFNKYTDDTYKQLLAMYTVGDLTNVDYDHNLATSIPLIGTFDVEVDFTHNGNTGLGFEAMVSGIRDNITLVPDAALPQSLMEKDLEREETKKIPQGKGNHPEPGKPISEENKHKAGAVAGGGVISYGGIKNKLGVNTYYDTADRLVQQAAQPNRADWYEMTAREKEAAILADAAYDFYTVNKQGLTGTARAAEMSKIENYLKDTRYSIVDNALLPVTSNNEVSLFVGKDADYWKDADGNNELWKSRIDADPTLTKANKLAISFRGTQLGKEHGFMTNLRDFAADVGILTGTQRISARYTDAKKFCGDLALARSTNEPNNPLFNADIDLITGHSLGGGIGMNIHNQEESVGGGVVEPECIVFNPGVTPVDTSALTSSSKSMTVIRTVDDYVSMGIGTRQGAMGNTTVKNVGTLQFLRDTSKPITGPHEMRNFVERNSWLKKLAATQLGDTVFIADVYPTAGVARGTVSHLEANMNALGSAVIEGADKTRIMDFERFFMKLNDPNYDWSDFGIPSQFGDKDSTYHAEMVDAIVNSENESLDLTVPGELNFEHGARDVPGIWRDLPRDINGKRIPSLTDYKIYEALSNGRRPVGVEIMRIKGDSHLYVGRDNSSEIAELTVDQSYAIRNNVSDRYGPITPEEMTLTRDVGHDSVIDQNSTQLNRLWAKYVQRKQVGELSAFTDGSNVVSVADSKSVVINDQTVAAKVKVGDLFSGSGVPSNTRVNSVGVSPTDSGRVILVLDNAMTTTSVHNTVYSLHRGSMYFDASITEEPNFVNMPAINNHEALSASIDAAELADLNAGPDTGTVLHEVRSELEIEELNTQMGMISDNDMDTFLQLDENGQTVELNNLAVARKTAESNLTTSLSEGTGDETIRIAGSSGSGYALQFGGLFAGLVFGWLANKAVDLIDPNHKLGIYGDAALAGGAAGGITVAAGSWMVSSESALTGLVLGPEIVAGVAAGVVGTAVGKTVYEAMLRKGYSEKAAYAASATSGGAAGGFAAGIITTSALVATGAGVGEEVGAVIGTVGGPLGVAAGVVVGGLIGASIGAAMGGVLSLIHSLK